MRREQTLWRTGNKTYLTLREREKNSKQKLLKIGWRQISITDVARPFPSGRRRRRSPFKNCS